MAVGIMLQVWPLKRRIVPLSPTKKISVGELPHIPRRMFPCGKGFCHPQPSTLDNKVVKELSVDHSDQAPLSS
jgi:hypothetical protein